jgi:hypothetical protein
MSFILQKYDKVVDSKNHRLAGLIRANLIRRGFARGFCLITLTWDHIFSRSFSNNLKSENAKN